MDIGGSAVAYIWRQIAIWSPLRPVAAIADRGWRGPKGVRKDARLPTGYGSRLQVLACGIRRLAPSLPPVPAGGSMVRVRQQFAPPNWGKYLWPVKPSRLSPSTTAPPCRNLDLGSFRRRLMRRSG